MEPATPHVIDRAERARLAELVERFLRGGMSVSRFASEICRIPDGVDRGLTVIARTWCDCDCDMPVIFGRWQTIRSLPPDWRATLQRCRLFLHTDLPYEWPDPPNLALADLGQAILILLGMAALGNLLFGLVILFLGLWCDGIGLAVVCIGAGTGVIIGYRALKRWKHDQWADCTAAGDIDVWPFRRRGDYERALVPTHLPGPPS